MLEHIIPVILNPTINDPWAEIANRAASCPRGLKPFLEVGLTLVLIGWINQASLERAVELLKRCQLLECVQISMIATLECRERLPIIEQRLSTLQSIRLSNVSVFPAFQRVLDKWEFG